MHRRVLAQNLLILRGVRSQAWLADLAGVTQASVSYWERGHCVPSIEHLAKLASIYGVSVADLYTPGFAASFTEPAKTKKRRAA